MTSGAQLHYTCYSLFVEIPVEIVKDLQPLQCTEKEAVEFTCELNRETPVTWYKDGKPISADDSEYVTSSEGLVHRLVISAAKLDDEAEYKLVAGPATSTAELLVDGKCLKIKNRISSIP